MPYNPRMGGERASSIRCRQTGKVCCDCGASLPPTYLTGERLCKTCVSAKPRCHRVYLEFERDQIWNCQFLEENLKTALQKHLMLRDSKKLFEIAERGGVNSPGARYKIQWAIDDGRGGM